MSVQENQRDPEGTAELGLTPNIIASDKVYVPDMLSRLSETEFKTQEGTLDPLTSKRAAGARTDYEWQESGAGATRTDHELTAKGTSQPAELTVYWKEINATINQLGR